ncbi:hypothetical protein EV356DRAFT_89520 [Viridothelium virens]|uniref:Uncharacterized protein n=1 Tax=Viridothelium virens TaxID=1048519 RepID=A0A6A6HDF8_VIRVR|nr:hypothetical protein EV356DRAFT_89520 [Viridothelium virens]
MFPVHILLVVSLLIWSSSASSLYRRQNGAEVADPIDTEPSACQFHINSTSPAVDKTPNEEELGPLDEDESYYLFTLFEDLGLVDNIFTANGSTTRQK